MAEGGAFSLHLSDAILRETEGVLLDERRRLRRRYRYSDDAARRWLRALSKLAHRVTDAPTLRVVERDPKDDVIVATAVAANADYLVTTRGQGVSRENCWSNSAHGRSFSLRPRC